VICIVVDVHVLVKSHVVVRIAVIVIEMAVVMSRGMGIVTIKIHQVKEWRKQLVLML